MIPLPFKCDTSLAKYTIDTVRIRPVYGSSQVTMSQKDEPVEVEQGRDGPYGMACLLSQLFHIWVTGLFQQGYERTLNEDDLKPWLLDRRDDPVLHSREFQVYDYEETISSHDFVLTCDLSHHRWQRM